MNKWSEGVDVDRRSSPAKGVAFRNVSAPPGSRQANPYTRFIPREELGDFAAWKPSTLRSSDTQNPTNSANGDDSATRAPPPAPPPPTATEWAQRVDAARKQGATEGYQNGYRDGLVALESFKQSVASQNAAQVNALLQSMDDAISALQPALAQTVSSVALALAAQVLRSELRLRPEAVASVAAQALQEVLLSARHITMYLHPQDLALVEQGAADTLQTRGARLQARASLARGDCVIESDLGAIDARVATRWAQATASLLAVAQQDDDAAPSDMNQGGVDALAAVVAAPQQP